MKKTILTICIASLSLAGFAQKKAEPKTSGNPIFKGWYADPEAAIFGKEYWIYPTFSAKYEEQIFMDAFSSKDLVTWTKHPNILSKDNVKWANKAMWAPSITKKGNKYYLFFGANDIKGNGQLGGIGVAVSERAEGPFKDALGKPLIGAVHNGAQPIDQMVFKDDDGQVYLYYGGWRHLNVVRLAPDLLSVVAFADGTTYKEITPGPDYSVAYAMSDSPMGPFKRVAKILQQDSRVATGAGHHSVINIPGTDDWVIAYHRRPLGETDGNHREVAIEQLKFNTDGTIGPVTLTVAGVAPRPLAPGR